MVEWPPPLDTPLQILRDTPARDASGVRSCGIVETTYGSRTLVVWKQCPGKRVGQPAGVLRLGPANLLAEHPADIWAQIISPARRVLTRAGLAPLSTSRTSAC
jgi:hypothetical protein